MYNGSDEIRSIPKISFTMLKKLAKLVACSDQQVGVTVHVDDKVDCFKQNCILSIGMLHFLRLWRLLCLVQYRLDALCKSVPDSRIIYNISRNVLREHGNFASTAIINWKYWKPDHQWQSWEKNFALTMTAPLHGTLYPLWHLIWQRLTLSSPVVPNGYTTKCSKPYWSNPPKLAEIRPSAFNKLHQYPTVAVVMYSAESAVLSKI